MADIQYLEERIEKANANVEKCKGAIERHQKQLEKKLQVLVKKGVDMSKLAELKWNPNGGGSALYWEICEVESKQSDIKGANNKLENAEEILAGWQAKLSAEIEKERFLEGNAPEVIKEFLEEWKQKSYQWHVKKLGAYRELKEQLGKEGYEAHVQFVKSHPVEYANYLDENGEIKEYYQGRHDLHNVWPRKPLEDYLKEKELDYKSIKEKLINFAGLLVIRMDEMYNDEDALKWLAKELEAEKKRKMINLIYRINEIVGSIEDAEYLKVDVNGNLNGIVKGSKGSAKVETIGAGGWNIQCFHYRCLVHEVK